MIYKMLLEQVARSPNKCALDCDGMKVSYKGLAMRVRAKMNSIPSTTGWIVSPISTDIDGVILLLACAARGIALMPFKDGTSQEKIGEAVEYLNQMPAPSERPFLLLNTSGTTGDPKLITLSQRTKVLRVAQFENLYGVNEKDTLLVGTPLHTSMAQRLVLVALLNGATARMIPQYSPELWLAAAKQCTIVVGVPLQLKHLSSDTGKIRLVMSSSAPRLSDSGLLSALLATQGIEYHECYGASEVAIATSGIAGDTVGDVAPGVGIKISSEGEILVRSALLHSGYFGRPDMTAASMEGDFFKTGDAGYFIKEGLVLTGRLSERIKVGATTVWPEDVESVIRTIPNIIDCAATSVKDEKLGEVVMISVVADRLFTLKEIQKYCLDKLDDAQIPRRCANVDIIPRTELGKLQRRKL